MDRQLKTARLLRFGPEFFVSTSDLDQEVVLLFGPDGNFMNEFESVQHAKVWCAAAGIRLENDVPGKLAMGMIGDFGTAFAREGAKAE